MDDIAGVENPGRILHPENPGAGVENPGDLQALPL